MVDHTQRLPEWILEAWELLKLPGKKLVAPKRATLQRALLTLRSH